MEKDKDFIHYVNENELMFTKFVLKKAGVGTWIRDNKNDLVRLDENMISLWGMKDLWKTDEWVSFTEQMIPRIINLPETDCNKLFNTFSGKNSDDFFVIEHGITRLDGTIKNFEVRIEVHSRDENGVPIAMTGVNIDTTDLIQLKKQSKKFELLSSLDPMTNLYNRRFFLKSLQDIYNIVKRKKTNLSIAMIDIDKFKNINDSYGHDIGDEVIIKLSKKLQELTRDSDIICRWGGEEFIIAFAETSIKGATTIATKIKENIETFVIPEFRIDIDNEKSINFTVSIGVSEVNFTEESNNLEYTIKQADNALYQAKAKGGNRVCTA